MGLEQIYQERLRDHYHHPRNYGQLSHPDIHAEIISPTCGDSVTFSAHVDDNNVVTQTAFSGEGSILSQATASLLSEQVTGMHLQDIMQLDEAYVKQLIGLELGPNRMETAMLPLHVIQKGIQQYGASRKDTQQTG